MKVVVASSLKNLYGLRGGYIPIASAHVHTLSVGLAVGLDFMSVPDVSDSLLLLTELSFRWFNRDPKKVVTKTGKRKVIWKPKPLMEQLTSLLSFACGTQLRWNKTGALRQITSNAF